MRFAGAVDNVHEYLQASDLFVFPSEREAFGISIIEAMACGLPVVTTTVEGIRDVVRPEVDTVVVPPADDDALAAAILRVLRGGDAIAALAEAARQRVARDFSSASVVAAYRELLAGTLSR